MAHILTVIAVILGRAVIERSAFFDNPDGIVSMGFNITDTDAADCALNAASDLTLTAPLVGVLADYGGPTPTVALLATSPAIDGGDAADNCLVQPNPGQVDTDGDGLGNACDADFFDDCFVDFQDLGAFKANFLGIDPEFDLTNEGLIDFLDLGRIKQGFFQAPGPSGIANICP